MKRAYFRFYAELNDFLPPLNRMATFAYGFEVSGSVKDVIETLGVPHTEVELILANGEPVNFSWQVGDGDRISVYPAFRSLDLTPLGRLRPQLAEVRFVLDGHLGRLAAYLRLLGFDTLYRNDYRDEELAEISAREVRVLLTMDRGLLKRNAVVYGYFVRETEPRRQLLAVLRRFDLTARIAPFQRCLRCNTLLEPAAKEAVSERVPPKTRQYYEEFRCCAGCGRVYWKGSHYRRMQRLLEFVQRSASASA